MRNRVRRRIASGIGALSVGLAVALTGSSAAVAAQPTGSASPVADPTTLVNPYIGTQNQGNTFPGAALPFGMVQVSPDNGGTVGYDYDQKNIYGFSQTHLSGVGCGVNGELPLMPTTGAVDVDPSKYASTFSHSQETAHPGYYQVQLASYGINAELTATARTGWQRYTFPATAQANVLFNTGKADMGVMDSGLTIVGDDTIEGYVHDGGFCAGHDQHTIYFSAQFSRPFASFGTWRGATTTSGSRAAAGTGANGGWVTFDASKNQSVTVKVGVSYTGIPGARLNLAAETHNSFNFDQVRQAAHDVWQRQLRGAQVAGGSADQQTSFYTALYHTLLHPNLFGDVDNRYMGFDNKVHQATDYTPYANFSLWDTYRTQNQLLELLRPDVARNVDLSMLAVYREGGSLPRWELENSETNIMTGDPVTPFLVDGWSKGLLAGHEQEAYQALLANVNSEPPADSPFNGRNGNPWYLTDGYVPSGLTCVYKGGDNDCQHPASATLEYAAADASLSIMAKALGHTWDAAMLAQRGENYRKLWDASIGFFRPRNADGSWFNPYDPETGNDQFHESGAYQYQWLVPQDEPGMIGLLGGTSTANQRLDSFFVYSGLLTDPGTTVKTGWVNSPYGYYGDKTYNPNNEPDLQAPYTYLWTGQPDHTATVVHAQESLFANAPNGMTGNDDLGEMSAWLVMSSLGLYPMMSGADYYAVTSPAFPHATVHIGNLGWLQGGTLTIDAPTVSWDNRYITAMSVNNRATQLTWLSQAQIAHGGHIADTVSATPGTWGTALADAPPSVTGS
ncbi:MAG TPA: GH92 family glycosyl hydrolase [Pseudonocardiaceae bacterium]|jgi:predicted alpha-1,2-mannosidase|nr:GH92 family glycosyl hydrolase [Pseudonocardiaceae bacterium]